MVIPQSIRQSDPAYKQGYEDGFNCQKQMIISLLKRVIKAIEKEPAFKEYTATSYTGKKKLK